MRKKRKEKVVNLAGVSVRYRGVASLSDVVKERRKRLQGGSVEDYVVALDRFIKRAKKTNDDRVLIVGDYDADGISAAYVSYVYLRKFGFRPLVYVPLRKHGYGIKDWVFKRGITNVFVVDSGTNFDFRPYDGLYNVIVIDHHQVTRAVPNYETVEIVNPFLHKDERNEVLCAAGLAYKIFSFYEGEDEELMQVATVASVADVVPVIGSTHELLRRGFASINEKGFLNKGLREIAATKGVRFATYKSIGFGIAPVINATGRVSCGSLAFNLLRLQDEKLARKALFMNDKRKRIQRELEVVAKRDYYYEGDNVFLAFDDGYEQGVVGIVASRIAKEKNKLTIIGKKEGSVVKFSGRNPFEGINAVKLLESLSDYLIRFGGHEKAFGGEIEVEHAMEFATELDSELRKALRKNESKLVVDAFVQEFSLREIEESKSLYPFGPENEPLTVAVPVKVVRTVQNEYGYVVYAETKKTGRNFVLFSDKPIKTGDRTVIFSVDFNATLSPALRIIRL